MTVANGGAHARMLTRSDGRVRLDVHPTAGAETTLWYRHHREANHIVSERPRHRPDDGAVHSSLGGYNVGLKTGTCADTDLHLVSVFLPAARGARAARPGWGADAERSRAAGARGVPRRRARADAVSPMTQRRTGEVAPAHSRSGTSFARSTHPGGSASGRQAGEGDHSRRDDVNASRRFYRETLGSAMPERRIPQPAASAPVPGGRRAGSDGASRSRSPAPRPRDRAGRLASAVAHLRAAGTP